MKFYTLAAAAASLAVASAASASPVTMDWSTVGNPGNAPDTAVMLIDDTTGYGSVAYEYRIGTYEVTNEQYTAFLNAVAASDPNNLYSSSLGFNARSGIARSGTDGSYTYSVRENMGDKPVAFVRWYSAARMANWMTNGQPTGPQDNSTTESGVYTFDGVTSISAITRDLSNPNQVFLPTEDEWYKAAYHQPADQGGDIDDYWGYATQSNSVPTFATATSTGDVANPGANTVNYGNNTDWNGLEGHVTTVGTAGNTSYYGAYDMNGNVWEWNETMVTQDLRGLRGGSYFDIEEIVLRSTARFGGNPANLFLFDGFRLAASPVADEPACPADFNDDGQVDGADFGFFGAAFGSDAGEQSYDPRADFNNDGTIDGADFGAFGAQFGRTDCVD